MYFLIFQKDHNYDFHVGNKISILIIFHKKTFYPIGLERHGILLLEKVVVTFSVVDGDKYNEII